MDTRDFLVPDNYADFHCKCGQCRHTCCDGWAVTFPREDYFRLLSVPCSPELRRKLDTSLHLADDPTPERYAELLPNWEGHCPLARGWSLRPASRVRRGSHLLHLPLLPPRHPYDG